MYKRSNVLRNRLNNPIRYLLQYARHRAKINGLDFDLEEGDLELISTCPVLKIPILDSLSGRASPYSLSLDRIDNNLGYVKGNVILVSDRANRLKKDATLEEIAQLAEFYCKKPIVTITNIKTTIVESK